MLTNFLKNSSFCLNQVTTFIGCTPLYSEGLIRILIYYGNSEYSVPFIRTKLFEIIPSTLCLCTKLLKSTRIHYVYAPLLSVFFRTSHRPTYTKKPDFYPHPYSVPNGNQDLERFFFEAYFSFLWGRFFESFSFWVKV